MGVGINKLYNNDFTFSKINYIYINITIVYNNKKVEVNIVIMYEIIHDKTSFLLQNT